MENESHTSTGWYILLGLVVSALCVGALLYIGWMNNKSHVDSRNGDNVLSNYQIETAQPDAPGENDWQNPQHSSLQQVIVNHASGTNTTQIGE